jgi:hypothetical protein
MVLDRTESPIWREESDLRFDFKIGVSGSISPSVSQQLARVHHRKAIESQKCQGHCLGHPRQAPRPLNATLAGHGL